MTLTTCKESHIVTFGMIVAKITAHATLSYVGVMSKFVSWVALLLAGVFGLIQISDWAGMSKVPMEEYFVLPFVFSVMAWKALSVFGDFLLKYSESDLIDFCKYPEKSIAWAIAVLLITVVGLAGVFQVFPPEALGLYY